MKTSHGLSEEQTRIYMSQLGTIKLGVYPLSDLLTCHWCVVASGLQFLRSQNVVHRDLKPANLLLSSKNLATAKLKIGALVSIPGYAI